MSFFPKEMNTIHPLYHETLSDRSTHDLKSHWQFKTFAFDKFYDNMLLVWITGLEAEYSEGLGDAEISATLTDLLRKLLANPSIPEPNKLIKTNWYSNEYMLGSYSYVDVAGTANHIEDLAEPICVNGVPRVLFAGEACSPRYYSTVHGAYLSGQREAKRLVNFYSNEN